MADEAMEVKEEVKESSMDDKKVPEKGEEKSEEKKDEAMGDKMDLGSLITGAMMNKGGEGKGALWGLGGLVLGNLLNNNGNGLFGNNNNADRACITDTLIQSTANATQVQGLQNTYALNTAITSGNAAIQSTLCSMEAQAAMNAAAGIQATKDGTCAVINAIKDSDSARQAAEIVALNQKLLICELKQASPDIINVSQNVNALNGNVTQLTQLVTSMVPVLQRLSVNV